MSQSPPVASGSMQRPTTGTAAAPNAAAAIMRPPSFTLSMMSNSSQPPSTVRRKYSVFSMDSAPFAPAATALSPARNTHITTKAEPSHNLLPGGRSMSTTILSTSAANTDCSSRRMSSHIESASPSTSDSPSSSSASSSSSLSSSATSSATTVNFPSSVNRDHDRTVAGRGRGLLAGRDLEQHISKLISENAAIVQTSDPLWSKRSFGRTKTASNSTHDNASASTSTPPTHHSNSNRRYSEYSMSNQHNNHLNHHSNHLQPNSHHNQPPNVHHQTSIPSKLASALLGQTSNMSAVNHFPASVTNPLLTSTSIPYRSNRSVSLVTPPSLPQHYHHSGHLTPIMPYLPLASSFQPQFATGSFMQSMMTATQSNAPTIKVTPAPLDHPDNPEGSIIKDLLLKCQQEAYAASNAPQSVLHSAHQVFDSMSTSLPFPLPIIPTAAESASLTSTISSHHHHHPFGLPALNQLVPFSRRTSLSSNSLPYAGLSSASPALSQLSPSDILQLAQSPASNAAIAQILPPEVQNTLNSAIRYLDSNRHSLRNSNSSLTIVDTVDRNASAIPTSDQDVALALTTKSSAADLVTTQASPLPSSVSISGASLTTTSSMIPSDVVTTSYSSAPATASVSTSSIDPDELSMLVYVCTICRIAFRKKETLEIHQLHYCRQNPNLNSDAFKRSDDSFVSGDFPASASFTSFLKQQFANHLSPAGLLPTNVNTIGQNATDLTLPKKRKISEPVFPSNTFGSQSIGAASSRLFSFYDQVDGSAGPTFTRKISVLQQPNKPPHIIHLKRPVFAYTPPNHLQHVVGQPANLTATHFHKSIDSPIVDVSSAPDDMTSDSLTILDVTLGSLKSSDLHVISDYLVHFNRKVTIKGKPMFSFLQTFWSENADQCDYKVDLEAIPTTLSPLPQVASMAQLLLESIERKIRSIDYDLADSERLQATSDTEIMKKLSDVDGNSDPIPRLICSQQVETDPVARKQPAEQRFRDGQVYSSPFLPTSTLVTFCCSYRVQPMHTLQSNLSGSSVYSNWPTLEPLDEIVREHRSICLLLSAYNSSNGYRRTREGYRIGSPCEIAYKLSDSQMFVRKSFKAERSELRRQLKEYKSDFCEESNDFTDKLRKKNLRKTSEDRMSFQSVDSFDDSNPLSMSFSQLIQSSRTNESNDGRVRIFDGGFKCNAEYTYVRGRGRGKYVCGECGIRCKKPSMLRKHIRTHTDLRPYSCGHCSFAFKTKGNLTKHMKSKAHQKKCAELGIWPIPTAIDPGTQIDRAALALQEALEKACNQTSGADDDEEDDDDDITNQGEEDKDDEEDEEDDELEDDEENDEDDVGQPIDRLPLDAIRAGIGALSGYLGVGGGISVAAQPSLSFQMTLKQLGRGRKLFDTKGLNKFPIPRVGSFDSSTTASALEQFEDADESEDTRDANSPFDERFESIRDNLNQCPHKFPEQPIPVSLSLRSSGNSAVPVCPVPDTGAGLTTLEEQEIAKSLLCLSESCSQPPIKFESSELIDNTNEPTCYSTYQSIPVRKSSSQTTSKRMLNEVLESSHPTIEPPIKLSRDILLDREQPIDLSGKPMRSQHSLQRPDRLSLQEHLQSTIEKHEKILNQTFRFDSGAKAPGSRYSCPSQSIKTSLSHDPIIKSICKPSSNSTILPLSSVISHRKNAMTITSVLKPTPSIESNSAVNLNSCIELPRVSSIISIGVSSPTSSFSLPTTRLSLPSTSSGSSIVITSASLLPSPPRPLVSLSSISTTSSSQTTSIKNNSNFAITTKSTTTIASTSTAISTKASLLGDDSKINICSICNKTFSKVSQLRLHVNIHYFERPYRCECCSVSFRTNGHLQKHLRSGSHWNRLNMNATFGQPSSDNPRPFKCVDCKSAFRIHGHLAKHLRSKMHILKLECLGKLPFGIYSQMERNQIQLNDMDTTDCETSLRCLMELADRLYANGDLPTPLGENAAEPPPPTFGDSSNTADSPPAASSAVTDGEASNLGGSTDGNTRRSDVSVRPRLVSSGSIGSNSSSNPPQQVFHYHQRHPHHWFVETNGGGEPLPHGHPLPKATPLVDLDDEDTLTGSSCSSPRPTTPPVDHPRNASHLMGVQDNSNSAVDSTLNAALNESKDAPTRLPESSSASNISSIASTRSNTCTICSQVFKSAKFLQIHLYCDHGHQGDQHQAESKNQTPSPVISAGPAYVSSGPDKNHTVSSSSTAALMWTQAHFSPSQQLQVPMQHFASTGKPVSPLFDENNNSIHFRIPERIAHQSFASSSSIARHECRTCGKRFDTLGFLHQHLLSHTTPRPFVCDICDAGFTSAKMLDAHLISHTSMPQHGLIICHECGLQFSNYTHFQLHVRQHAQT